MKRAHSLVQKKKKSGKVEMYQNTPPPPIVRSFAISLSRTLTHRLTVLRPHSWF